jgi:putative (di)nucleoside polyphosphate hydrolase
MKFLGRDSEIDLQTPHPEFSEWRWLPLGQLLELAVPFKRDIYGKVIAAFADLAKHG